MAYKKILITGGSGRLGRTLIKLGFGKSEILAPSSAELDITDKRSVEKYFSMHDFDAIIHCAALASVVDCEKDPKRALLINSIGTNNLVEEAIRIPGLRFVYISTDYIYSGINGPHKESDPAEPFTVYGWSKYGGECAVNLIRNHCIIRTSFFEPDKIMFNDAPTDSLCSKIPVLEVAKAVRILLEKEFIGVINVGQERDSIYNILRKYKPEIKKTTIKEIAKTSIVPRAADSSLDVSLWNEIKEK